MDKRYDVVIIQGGHEVTHMSVPAIQIVDGKFIGYKKAYPIVRMTESAPLPTEYDVTCGFRFSCD
jgi:hypothetical protein